MHPRACMGEQMVKLEIQNSIYFQIKSEAKKRKSKEFPSPDPDVQFLVDGKVRVQVDHLWCSVCWSGVSCNLQREKSKII